MPKLSLVKGKTSYLARIFIQDSSSTTGGGLTGLTSGSSGLVCYRARDDDGNAAGTAITLSGGTRGTWSSGGFVEKDATNMPGVYEFGVPNAALATGSNSVLIMFKGATNMAPLPLEIELTGIDNQDAVRAGMTALPNAAAEAAGGLYTRGTGAGQINQTNNGQVDANAARTGGTTNTGRDIGASVLLSTGTGTGQLDFTSGVVKANLAQILGTALTETAGFLAAGFKKFFNVSATPSSTMDVLARVTLTDTVTTYTGNTPQTGDAYARLGAPAGASTAADIAAAKAQLVTINADTDDIQTRIPAALVSGRIDASVGAMAAAVLTATAIASNAFTAAKFAANALDAVWSTTARLLTAGTNIVLAKGTGVTGFNDVSTTDVKTQITDALNVDTYAEPGQEAPGATVSLVKKIGYVYKAFRNRSTLTSTAYKLYADNATTVDQKSTVSDDGTTFDSGEKASGP